MLEEYSDNLTNIEIFPNGKFIRIIFDPTVRKFKLICKRYELLEEIQNAFSATNPGAFFASRYGYKQADKIYAVNKFGYFDVGLIFEILQWIINNYGDYSGLIISQNCKNYIRDYITPLKNDLSKNSNFQIYNVAEDLGRNNELKRDGKQPFEYREYQKNSVEYLITKGYGKGLIEIPTAGGKSFILANFIWNIHKNFNTNFKYLILVPSKQLVEQFYKDLLDYGFSIEKLTRFTAGLKKNEAFNSNAQIIIANKQYVFNNKIKLPKIDVLICDEAHTATAAASSEFIESLNCKIKIGCSGTLPRDKYLKWKLIGLFSRVVYTEDITKLQDEGFISKLKITQLNVIDKYVAENHDLLFNLQPNVKYESDEFGNSNIAFDEAYKAEHEYFEKNYIDLYRPIFEYLLKLSENILVLFDRIEIGKNLYEISKDFYKDKKECFYIDGTIDVNVREEIRANFEKKDGNLLIAQRACMATGVNIKRLTHLVLLVSSKSFFTTIQSIGRTLRLHETKREAHLIDCAWNYKYSQRHLKERQQIYKQMYGKKLDEQLTFYI